MHAEKKNSSAKNSSANNISTNNNSSENALSPVEPKQTIGYSIDIYQLNKSFKRKTLNTNGYTTFKTALLNLFKSKKASSTNSTIAVKDLTLRVPKGSSVGIIGRNGSGKSSLLKLITGIYKPDSGHISVQGKLAALIELGAGFHPDFTGRENLYLAGAMYGLSKSAIKKLLPQIISFAELTDVIDDPVRTYSSGMFMRLGFSLAIHIDPEVLLVDEVLAVGDAGFNAKCKDRISSYRKAGKTLLMVSHDLAAIERWCDEVVWLDKGVVKDRGEPKRVISSYVKFLEDREDQNLLEQSENDQEITENGIEDTQQTGTHTQNIARWGSREIEITGVQLLSKQGENHMLFHPDDPVTIKINYRINGNYSDPVFGIAIHRSDGVLVHGTNTAIEKIIIPKLNQEGIVEYKIDRLALLSGSYTLDLAVHTDSGYPYDYRKGIVNFVVRAPQEIVGVYSPVHTWSIK